MQAEKKICVRLLRDEGAIVQFHFAITRSRHHHFETRLAEETRDLLSEQQRVLFLGARPFSLAGILTSMACIQANDTDWRCRCFGRYQRGERGGNIEVRQKEFMIS